MTKDSSDIEAFLAKIDEDLRRARIARANLRRTLDRNRRELG